MEASRQMRFSVILNRHGGTLRTLDVDDLAARIANTLGQAGHEVSTHIVEGKGIVDAIEEAVSGECDVVMVGGGDGTASCAAGKLKDSDKVLAILPAGTMNLFARSLRIPLDLDEAVEAFAQGEVREVDLASANGRIFVHQFSIGLHAKLIRLREKDNFDSRLGKMWASVRAGFRAFFSPPRMKIGLTLDEGEERLMATAGVGVTNNLFGEGHLPYADEPDRGVLGVYVTRTRRKRDMVWLALNMLLGRWKSNQQVDVHEARTVTLRLLSRHERFGCAMDGELCDLETETVLHIHPRALKVLTPPPEA